MEWSGRRPRHTDSHLLCKFIQRHASPMSENFFHPARCLLLVCNQKEITWKQGAKEYLKSWYLLITFFKHNLTCQEKNLLQKKKKLEQVSEFSLKPFSGEFSVPYLPCSLIRLWLRGSSSFLCILWTCVGILLSLNFTECVYNSPSSLPHYHSSVCSCFL